MNRRRTTFAIAFAAAMLTAVPAPADGVRAPNTVVEAVPVKAGGTVLSVQGGVGVSFAGTENDGDQEVDGYEEMNVYSGVHAELSVFVGKNLVRGKQIFFDMGYHGHLSLNDVDVIQRHQFALVLARDNMFGLLGLGGSVLHDVGFEAFAPFASMSVIAGYRMGPVSVSFPFGVEFPLDGSPPIETLSMLVGYSDL